MKYILISLSSLFFPYLLRITDLSSSSTFPPSPFSSQPFFCSSFFFFFYCHLSSLSSTTTTNPTPFSGYQDAEEDDILRFGEIGDGADWTSPVASRLERVDSAQRDGGTVAEMDCRRLRIFYGFLAVIEVFELKGERENFWWVFGVDWGVWV